MGEVGSGAGARRVEGGEGRRRRQREGGESKGASLLIHSLSNPPSKEEDGPIT